METLEFKLGAFEGPLELLLHLISRHKMKITDIEIGKLLEQYLAYMEEMQDADLEVSSAFLEMAARLVYIKTVSLLPRHEEAAALKKELEGQLIEYQKIKIVAGFLAERYNGGTSLFVRAPSPIRSDPVFRGNMPPEKLLSAYILAAGKQAGGSRPPQTLLMALYVSGSYRSPRGSYGCCDGCTRPAGPIITIFLFRETAVNWSQPF